MSIRTCVNRLRSRWRSNSIVADPVVSDADFLLPKLSSESVLAAGLGRYLKLKVSQVQRPRDMVLPLVDLLMIAAICSCRGPKRILEIGTYTGETTQSMAVNTGDDCEIFTLDLPLNEVLQFGDFAYEIGEKFVGTPESSKITQLFGRSQEFDFSPFYNSMDLILIDGDHSFDVVKSDTHQALKMVRPGGLVVWDDYRYLPCHIGCKGVADYLHTLKEELPIFQLDGTRLAVLEFKP